MAVLPHRQIALLLFKDLITTLRHFVPRKYFFNICHNFSYFQLEIKETNKNLQKSGTHLLLKGEELTKARRKQHNIALTIDTLSQCLPVLETYAKLRDQMKNKRSV